MLIIYSNFLCNALSNTLPITTHVQQNYDVFIVGAGYAGLTAGRLLSKAGKKIHLAEYNDYPGGRVQNHNFVDGSVGELGGEWIGNKTCQPHAWKLFIEELKFDVFDTDCLGKGFYYSTSGKILEFTNNCLGYTDIAQLLSVNQSSSLLQAIEWLDSECQTVTIEPWTHPKAEEYDSMTFQTWINNQTPDEEVRQVLRHLCTMQIAQSPKTTSLLHILYYIKMSGGVDNIWNWNQQYRLQKGSQAPAIKMAEELSPNISFNCNVLLINQSATPIEIHTTCGLFLAMKVIVTGAPIIVTQIQFVPELPFFKFQLFQRIPMGNSVKLEMIYKTPFWKEMGLNGKIYSTNLDAPVRDCLDNTPYHPGSPGILLCFAEGQDNIRMMNMTNAERIETLGLFFEQFLGKQARTPEELLFHNWATISKIRGAYAGFMTPGTWTQYGPWLKQPFNNIHFAGTEYADRGHGFMDGAINSAQSVVSKIISQL